MTTPDARLARLEQLVSDTRDDVSELRQETERTRGRLHNAEGLLATLVEQEKFRREATQRRDQRIGLRLQILTGVVAAAALVEPFLYHLATGG